MLFRSSSIQNGAQIAVFVPNIVHSALRSATSGLSVKRPMPKCSNYRVVGQH